MRNASDEIFKENRNIFCLVNFFLENRVVFETMWNKYCRAGQATEDNIKGACPLHAGYLRLQTRTLRMCNTYCFSSAKMIAQTRLNVTFIRTLAVVLQ